MVYIVRNVHFLLKDGKIVRNKIVSNLSAFSSQFYYRKVNL